MCVALSREGLRAASAAVLLSACLAFGSSAARADDRFTLDGDVDVRWVHATGETSFMNGGLGIVRFDPDHEGLELGRAFLAPNWRINDLVALHAVIDTYGDHNRNPVDLSEFYFAVHPFPSGPIRWRARVGAFFMPVSMENRGIGWTDVYSITPSALNTWMGEEFRTIGAEVEGRWLGASSGYLGDIAIIGAVYGWNEPAGVLLANRGFAMTDRPSTLFGSLGSPPMGFYHQIDRDPGYYAGLSWRHHDRLEIRALHYDNRADPSAHTASELYAWRTRFNSAGARLEPDAHWTFIAQYLDGDTAVDSDDYGDIPFLMNFRAAFALASFEWGPERLTARYDAFRTRQLTGLYAPPSNQDGHAWTFAWTRDFGDHWEFVAEWLHVFSSYPPRAELLEPVFQAQTEIQLAVRYRFRLAW
jgi:hypothetical protein